MVGLFQPFLNAREGKNMANLKIRTISSLEKCFTDDLIENTKEVKRISVMKNETVSFQVAYQMEDKWNKKINYFVQLEGPIKDHVKMYRVMEMPSATPIMDEEHDEDILKNKAGLFPDLLLPLESDEKLFLGNHRLVTLWFDVIPDEEIEGEYPLDVVFTDDEKKEIGRTSITIKVYKTVLPKQEIIHTEWFYCDTLMSYYNTKPFDDRHWKIIEKFMRVATNNGINMILTPLFTYALDTAIGSERPTTQLVKVKEYGDGQYEFGFELFEKYIELAKKCGYEYFEMSHFFTQWGAKATPKIVAETSNGEKRIFGWDVASDDPGYFSFLNQFVPKLREELKRLEIEDKTFYHVSDEANEKSLDSYKKCYDFLKGLVPEEQIIDAMSNYSFYERKVLTKPIPSTGAVQKFIDAGVKNLWTYYCCDARLNLSNRYFAMPSYRTRVLGIQLYLNDIKGFLHWGYNFYYSQYSLRLINPFLQTDCDGFAESGDAFLVYPGQNEEPLESIRLKLIRDAFLDIRALKLLESIKGREFTENLIKEELGNVTFEEFPRYRQCYVNFRERLNSIIGEEIK